MSYHNEKQSAIGALWIKTSKKGTQFMSGKIEIDGVVHSIVCFANRKTKDNQPDYQILLSEDRRNSQESNQQALSEQGQEPPADEINIEDIPM